MREVNERWVATLQKREGWRPYLWKDGEHVGGHFVANYYDTLRQCEDRCAELNEGNAS